jgi:hypothetical protein
MNDDWGDTTVQCPHCMKTDIHPKATACHHCGNKLAPGEWSIAMRGVIHSKESDSGFGKVKKSLREIVTLAIVLIIIGIIVLVIG